MNDAEVRQSGDAAGREWESLARTASLASQAASEEPEALRELLVFDLAESSYAIPVERVREIVRLRIITPMPRVPAEILGVIALRGEVVQIVDLRMRLGLESAPSTRRTRIIVLHGDDDRVAGVLVDGVREVVRISDDTIRPSTGGEGDAVAELFVRGEDFVSILDLDRVLEFRGAQ